MKTSKSSSKRDWEATIIQFFAMLVGITRWTGANLSAEGFIVPEEWLDGWIVGAAILSACMAVVEAWAFGYCGKRLSEETVSKHRKVMAILMAISGCIDIVVITPYVMAQVEGVRLFVILQTRWVGVLVWSLGVALSTIAILATVGYCSGRGQLLETRQARRGTDKEEPKNE